MAQPTVGDLYGAAMVAAFNSQAAYTGQLLSQQEQLLADLEKATTAADKLAVVVAAMAAGWSPFNQSAQQTTVVCEVEASETQEIDAGLNAGGTLFGVTLGGTMAYKSGNSSTGNVTVTTVFQTQSIMQAWQDVGNALGQGLTVPLAAPPQGTAPPAITPPATIIPATPAATPAPATPAATPAPAA